MIQHKRTDINILLGALLLFSLVIGLLHSMHIVAKDSDKDTQEKGLTSLTTDEALEMVQPLIESDSLEKVVQEVQGTTLDKMIPIITKILENTENSFDRNDKLEFILGVAAGYTKPKERTIMLDFILDQRFPELRTGEPILYVAALSSYPQVIPMIKEWYSKRVSKQSNRNALKEALEVNAINMAIKKKDLIALQTMQHNGVSMPKERVSKALHEAINDMAGHDIVAYFLDQGADINYGIAGYTPLMRAIENKDLDTVKLLIERGADANTIIDNAVGSALQIASAKELVFIEAYLIEHGAEHSEFH